MTTTTTILTGALRSLSADQAALSALVAALRETDYSDDDIRQVDLLAARRDASREFARGVLTVEALRLGVGDHRIGDADVRVADVDISNGRVERRASASLGGTVIGASIWEGLWSDLPQ